MLLSVTTTVSRTARRVRSGARVFVALTSLASWAFCTVAGAQTGPGVLAFSPAIVAISEGAGSVTLTVARSQGSSGSISVTYTTLAGTATSPGDYTSTVGTLNWSDGDAANKTFTVPVIQNATLEGTRYFNVVLGNAMGGASIASQNGGLGKAIVRIADDEPDTFPTGTELPAGFTGGGWSVEPEGYLSSMGLGSPPVVGWINYDCYDQYPYDECIDGILMPGRAALNYSGAFLDGNLSFAYRIAGARQSTFQFFINGIPVVPATQQRGWQTMTIPISKGERNFSWEFSNYTISACQDIAELDGLACADRLYVDSIVLPPKANRLTLELVGSGTLTISDEADCATRICHHFLAANAVVTLVPVPGPGYFFGGWGGPICDGSFPCIPTNGLGCTGLGSCTLTMDAAKTVSARFIPLLPTLTAKIADVSNPGTGTITSAPAGINCPIECTKSFANGTVITLAATADSGSSFVGWLGGGCSGTGLCVVTLDNFTTVSAMFTNNFPPLTVQLSGAGTGVVTSNPPGINCPGTCTFPFPLNSQVTLTATPSPGSYGGILNSCDAAPQSCSVTISGPVSLSAQFQLGVIADPPTLVGAASSGSTITLNFLPPINTGGLPITSYRATCGALSMVGTTSPIALQGAMQDAVYSCAVVGVNAAGTSAPSNALNTVPQLALLSVVSRKIHGGTTNCERTIKDTVPFSGAVTIEPRMIGPGHQLVFTFNSAITSVGFVSSSTGIASPIRDNNKLIVTLTDVPDNRRVLVQLTDVTAAGGVLSKQLSVGFLVGDVSQSGKVSAADFAAIKANSGQSLSQNNCLLDVDLSGAIDKGDLAAAKARAGVVLP